MASGAPPLERRSVFANQLRGLAAAAVAFSHLAGVFWTFPDLVNGVTGSPPPAAAIPAWLPRLIYFSSFNFGPFGVGLFFLISGLVVPLSLASHTPGRFLLARTLRIWPVLLAATAVELATLLASHAWWGQPYHPDWPSVIGNGLLLWNYLNLAPFDYVSWTLCVEWKFYLLLALIAKPVKSGSLGVVVASGVILLFLAIAAPQILSPLWATTLGTECSYLIFMLIGVVFCFRVKRQITLRQSFIGLSTLLLLYVICWFASAAASQGSFRAVVANYFYALFVFTILFVARRHVPRFLVLDALAAISYPLYLIHFSLGLCTLRLLTAGLGWSYGWALTGTVAVLLAAAALLHVMVERPSIYAGRLLRRPAHTTAELGLTLTAAISRSTSVAPALNATDAGMPGA